jgi:multidrug resistance efflux pump
VWLGVFSHAAVRLATVQRAPLAVVLHELGYVAARNEVPVLTRFGGEVVWRADDGVFVEAGDPVVRFDAKAISEEVEDREKDLADKKDAVRRAQADIDTARDRYKLVLRQKEIDLAKARLERELIFGFPNADDKLDVVLSLKAAQTELQRYQTEADAYAELARRGFVSDAALKTKQLDLAIRKSNYAKAKTIHDLTLMGSTEESKRVAELAVADAQKALHVATFNRDADLAIFAAALELAKIDLANCERDLARRKQRLDWTTVRAPVGGRVVFQNVWIGSSASTSPIVVGETRAEGMDLCTILETNVLRVIVWVNESDVGRVAEGQQALVRLPAVSERTFEAVVKQLGVVATDKNVALSDLALRRAGEAFVNVVKVKLEFTDMPADLRAEIRIGFTADVSLLTQESTPALALSWHGIGYDAQGAPYADVYQGGPLAKVTRRALKLGRSNNLFAEVLEGLAENEQVVALAGAAGVSPADNAAPKGGR